MDMKKVVAAYKDAALHFSIEYVTQDGCDGATLNENFDVDDIAPDTAREMERDCYSFVWANRRDLRACRLSPERIGVLFWLNRNRHGAGFWDEGLSEVGKRLSEAAHAYGAYTLTVGRDRMIHGS